MRLTLVHPCIGRRVRQPYIRAWQMEPLAPATLAGLTPRDVEVKFYDDRMERIPYDEPTDLVAMSVETYTAKRAYQIASEYRRRGVPVVMGGFHPTLVPEEASEYAESIVVGEAEGLWPQVLDDFRAGRLQCVYKQAQRPSLCGLRPDRSIFAGKRYLPVGLVEAGRGCHFRCEFCAIQSYFNSTQTRRPVAEIIEEINQVKKPLIFFVDDNITSNMEQAKEFFRALIPLKIRWVSQASINAAHDEEFLQLIKASGCQGLLIGFESLNPDNLRKMHKSFNTMKGGYEQALANLRRHGIRLYVTFILGYDDDDGDTLQTTLEFAMRHKFYIVAFNHLTPFPGTPLYERLEREGRLLYDKWWLHPEYRYGMVPFVPRGMSAELVKQRCIEARQAFYSLPSIFKRSLDPQVNAGNWFMWSSFFTINLMFRGEVMQRKDYPLGDEAYKGELLKVGAPILGAQASLPAMKEAAQRSAKASRSPNVSTT
ncbi:MAG: B12-binding domain-containing radical SAM protein [Acidobacteria bacterium]|nr:B12-binding domain-containing radical SAM protein [Acidobacteriota bacterium]MBI3423607.1 B12-binding domain-containing radical SAM protein [Acidobacteriota bacterium]